MSRMVIRPRIQIPILVVIFTVWALLGTYFTSRDVVAERDWFGIVLGCVLVTSGVAGIWRAVRLGVVIDAEGVRVRGFDSRDQVTPWSAIQSVDCAQIDVRGGLPLYAPVLRLVDDAPAMPLSFRGTEVDPFLSHHAGAASKRSFRDGVVSRRSRSWNQRAAAGWTAGHEESGKALVRDCEETTMTEYLITFNDEWVPDHTAEELREKATAVRAVIEEMQADGVLIFTNGGLDRSTAVCSVEPVDGKPVFTDGPYVETKEHLGGFAVVDVPDDAAARYWAGRLATVLDWPQEVHRFRGPGQARRNGSGEK